MDLFLLFVCFFFFLSTSFNLIHLLLLYDDHHHDEQEEEEKNRRKKEACFQFISNANSIKSYRVSVYSSSRIHALYIYSFAVPQI